jgi:spore germination protein YaaH/uncharacterized protein YraI
MHGSNLRGRETHLSARRERPLTVWDRFTRLVEGPTAWLFTFVLFPLLLVAVLLLPPVNLLDRLEAFTYTRISAAGGALRDPDGTVVSFPSEGVDTPFFASLKSTPRADFTSGNAGQALADALKNLPNTLVPKSPIYQVRLRGVAPSLTDLRIPIPNDSLPYETLSVYGWNGQNWELLPSAVLAAEDVIEANLEAMPANFVVMQTSMAVPAAMVDLAADAQLPQNANVAFEARAGLSLRGDGALDGVAPANNGKTLPVIRNWEGSSLQPKAVRTDLINNLLVDPGQKDNQVVAVRETIVRNGYPGVIIDYRGVDALPSAAADYANLIQRIADELHSQNKTLAVRVEAPQQVSTDEWNSGGYNWRALGKAVDTLILPAPIDPRAYQPGGEMDALLKWATGEVDRRKIQVEFAGQSIERADRYLLLKGYKEALQPLVENVRSQVDGNDMTLTLDNPNLMSQVTWDEGSGMYRYSYKDNQGAERTVYIENEGSFKYKLSLLQKYNISNVNLIVPANNDIDPNLWKVIFEFQQGARLNVEKTPISVAYTVYGADGKAISSASAFLENSSARLAAASGAQKVAIQLADRSGNLLPVSKESLLTPLTAAPLAAKSADSVPVVADPPQDASIRSSQIVNIRQGPGTNYALIGQIAANGVYRVVGKNNSNDWWQIDLGNGLKGWVIGQLVEKLGDMNKVSIATDIPEAPQVQIGAAGVAPSLPEEKKPEAPKQAASVLSAPPPSGAIPFGYGIQAHMVDTSDGMIAQVMGSVKGMGMSWAKSQIEWKRFEAEPGAIDFGPMDPIINAANASGVSVLFSIVNAPPWAREAGADLSVGGPPSDPATYARFVGAVAGKYCGSSLKMVEVWNEQNLHYEWGNKPLNPGDYVALLAQAYAAIKNACPSMYVVSGALTPAGNNGNLAVDDVQYLEGMFAAGANNYFDGLGAHPSGYNVPPWATWDTACAEIQKHGNSFNGACDSPHHSWSFRSTMESYRNVMTKYGAANKVIIPTEFGWAAGGAFNPAYAYANDNDFDEQAAWTVEAYKMAKSWGWVGPMFLWNLNFRVVANGTEKAQWGIVDSNWGPLPAYIALQNMPK